MNKNKQQPNVPSPIYKAPAAANGAGESGHHQPQQLPNPAFKQPNIPTANQINQAQMTSPTEN